MGISVIHSCGVRSGCRLTASLWAPRSLGEAHRWSPRAPPVVGRGRLGGGSPSRGGRTISRTVACSADAARTHLVSEPSTRAGAGVARAGGLAADDPVLLEGDPAGSHHTHDPLRRPPIDEGCSRLSWCRQPSPAALRCSRAVRASPQFGVRCRAGRSNGWTAARLARGAGTAVPGPEAV